MNALIKIVCIFCVFSPLPFEFDFKSYLNNNGISDYLKPDTDKDLEQMKASIVELLSMEIVRRYYYQKGEIIQALKTDEGLAKAIEVLKNKEEYNKILNIKN